MKIRVYLYSKEPTRPPGTVKLRLFPVPGAKENEELLGKDAGELCLDSVDEKSVKDMLVPTEEERTGMKENPVPGTNTPRIPTGKPIIPYQEYFLTLTRAN